MPAQLTTFIGRERERAELRNLLRDCRLLTLTGPGGVGKTRLALQIASDTLNSEAERTEGVWLVQLADVVDPALVPYRLAFTLDVAEAPRTPMLSSLLDALRSRSMLLILDNCEHLVAACATLVESLLRACPRVAVLATSREPLSVPGEHVWPVRPLALPAVGEADELDSEALALFADRAQALAPGFRLTRANRPAIAGICRKVEGLPLAIELAAAHVRVLSVQELADRLEDRLGLLTGGSRTAAARQATMRAAIDWSYELLPDDERRLFNRLSVFAGGFTLRAAETVCSGEGIAQRVVLNLLGQVIAKSLVTAEGGAAESRYRLLEPIRQYAHERLVASGELAALRERHARFFLELAEDLTRESSFVGAHTSEEGDGADTSEAASLDQLEREHDNLRAALRWSLDSGAPELGMRLAGALSQFWHIRGHFREGHDWLTAVLTDGPEDRTQGGARASALWGLGQFKWRFGEYDAARQYLVEALRLQRRAGDDVGAGLSLSLLGRTAHDAGEYRTARRLDEEALAVLRPAGNTRALARAILDAGRTAWLEGDSARARALLEETVALCRELRPGRTRAVANWAFSYVLCESGEFDAAEALLAESLTIECGLKSKQGIHRTLQSCVYLAAKRGDWRVAMRLFGVVEALGKQLGIRTLRPDLQQALRPARSALGMAAAERARNEGMAMTLDQAVEYVLVREEPVGLLHDSPSTADAARLTRREREIVSLISQGLSNRDIATRLCISEGTAGRHLENILAKLGLRSRTQVAAWALRGPPLAQAGPELGGRVRA